MTSQDAVRPAELPCELFRFEDDWNTVVLRLDSLDHRSDGTAVQARGTIEIDCGNLSAGRGVRGIMPTFVGSEDVDAWQQVLDSLDMGYDIAWRENLRATEVHVRWEEDDLLVVTVRDRMGLLTDVTTAVPVSDEWFDDAYHRLGRVHELFERRSPPRSVVSDA
ncbi:DUF5959 family protein [Promicromonospora iranensis]|uniref:Uncharacterized protein n=1 Tax=Promicromonospora iranensis TaxID=1105144 RepID=A0ABU2CHJ2_9MICO|nr:DUF5959 family protein [Promicromonospora iranensis]MDR7380804.1 hypothetical protein [Promicromonospora iranensis]